MNKDEIAKRLVIARGNRSRQDVATALDISVSAIQMYESGQRIPRDQIKFQLAKLYGVSVEELFYC